MIKDKFRKGKLVVISAPSGCGKTTITRAILEKHPEILFSVSATTRPKREGEQEGKDYYFLTREEFEDRIKKGDLIEWEEIFGNLYGTLKSEVQKALNDNKTMLFDIDVRGALSVKRSFPDQTILIFIKPPSLEVLKERLEKRKTEDNLTVNKRLERVPMELAQEKYFDFVVVNDDLEKAIEQVERIIIKTQNPKILLEE